MPPKRPLLAALLACALILPHGPSSAFRAEEASAEDPSAGEALQANLTPPATGTTTATSGQRAVGRSPAFAPSSGPPLGAVASSDDIAALFDRVSPAVVGLGCTKEDTGFYYGTGTIIDPDGLVITSTTVVPRGAENIRVYLRGGATRPARIVLIDEALELALVRIEAPADAARREFYPYAELGTSGGLRLGDPAFTMGNSFRSIETDDQVSLGKGIVSGFYALEKTLSQSQYTGPAIETSAPLNSGTDGGPLIDRHGRLAGILSLNYSRSRWLGTAVPIDAVKPMIRDHLGVFRDEEDDYPAYLGLSMEARGGDVRVLRVEPGSPADEAGVAAGDRIFAAGEGALAGGDGIFAGGEGAMESVPALRRLLVETPPGKPIPLRLDRDGKMVESSVVPWRRF